MLVRQGQTLSISSKGIRDRHQQDRRDVERRLKLVDLTFIIFKWRIVLQILGVSPPYAETIMELDIRVEGENDPTPVVSVDR